MAEDMKTGEAGEKDMAYTTILAERVIHWGVDLLSGVNAG